MTKNAIILSDILPRFNADYGHGVITRTVGAYRIASALHDVGCPTRVLEYFFHLTFETQKKIIDSLVDANTVIIGISATNARGHTKTLKQHSLFDKFKPLKSNSNSLFYYHKEVARIIDYIKEKYPSIKMIVGGGQSTNLRLNQVKDYIDKNFDYYFTGESDISVQLLYKHLVENADLITYNNWQNSFVFKNTKIVHSEIDYPLTKDYVDKNLNIYHDKVQSNLSSNEWLFVEISRGCIFNCSFCSYKHSNKIRNIECIKNEIVNNYDNFKIDKFRLMDDTFNDSKEKVEEICNMFLSLPFKVEWHSYARTDIFNKYPELIDLMYRSGCRYLKFGLESTSNIALKYANKGSRKNAHERASWVIDEIHRRTQGKLFTHSNFIIGLPGETVETQMNTFEWIKSSKLKTFSFTTYFRDRYHATDLQIKEISIYGKTGENNNLGLTGYGNDWTHSTMSSTQAYELYNYAFEFFKNQKSGPYWVGSDLYPTLRSFGVNHDNVDSYMQTMFETYYAENEIFLNWFENNFISHITEYYKKIMHDFNEENLILYIP
jgi:radical SAM superfamily enzyme YgiQ (UPF0313 family)